MAKHHQVELDPVLYALKPNDLYQAGQTLLFFVSYFSCSYALFAVVFTGQKVNYQCAEPDNTSYSVSAELNGVVTDHSLPSHHYNTTSDVSYGQCSISVITNVSGDVTTTDSPCLYGIRYEQRRDFSVISEFDLVCKRAPLMSLSQTLLMLGQGIGAMSFTALSDRYGRKRIQIITHVLLTAGGVVIAFAPDYITFAIFKLLIGAVQQGVVLTTVTANVESYPGRYRGFVAGFLGAFVWAIITTTFTAWGYFLQDYSWRVLQAALTAVGLVVIPQIIFLREPLRWLLANGRTSEVVEQLKTAARVNKCNLQHVLDTFHRITATSHVTFNTDDVSVINSHASINNNSDVDGDERRHNQHNPNPNKSTQRETTNDVGARIDDVYPRSDDAYEGHVDVDGGHAAIALVEADMEEGRAEKLNFLDLIRHPRLRHNTLCLAAVWFTNSLTFFALILMSGSLTDNIYLGFFLNIIVEIPAALLVAVLIDRIGRRGTLLVFHALAAVSLLASGITLAVGAGGAKMEMVATVMSLVGKLGISGSFNCVFFFTPEIFPTNVRNMAIGTGSTAARVGGMIAPFVGELKNLVVWGPGALFGACNLLILIVVWRLPDSMGRELPQTLRDLELWYDPPDTDKPAAVAASPQPTNS